MREFSCDIASERSRLPHDARTPLECYLNGRLDRGGGGLDLVPFRICRFSFQALNDASDDNQFQATAAHSNCILVAVDRPEHWL
jgi:hypothetical protein